MRHERGTCDHARGLGLWRVGDVALRLPEPLHDVLVCHVMAGGEPAVDIGYRKPDGRWVLTGSDPEREIAPSHWMALPAPPLPEAA